MKSWKISLLKMCTMLSAILTIIACTADSGFEQVGYFKKSVGNSNNRVFSFYVRNFEDSAAMWEKIENHAKAQMYTQGGLTAVLYFNDRTNTPDVTLVGLEFPQSYEKYCVAGYWKYPTGKQEFHKYPFK
jgi:hypothetical protein